MNIYFLTLFPEHVRSYFCKGLIGRAIERGHISVSVIDIRKFGIGKHRSVDDYPYGGKQGMVLRADVLLRAIQSVEQYRNYRILYMCPKGPVFTQVHAKSYSESKGIILISGFYEGVDERIFELLPIERVSLGNFVATSGDTPAMTIADATCRYVPHVLGNPTCIDDESIASGFLEYPQFTAPIVVGDKAVPDVIRGGHHARLAEWRRSASLRLTLFKKPSLFIDSAEKFSEADKRCLTLILKENNYDSSNN